MFTVGPGSPRKSHLKKKKISFSYQLTALFPTVRSKTKSKIHQVPAILKKRGDFVDALLILLYIDPVVVAIDEDMLEGSVRLHYHSSFVPCS